MPIPLKILKVVDDPAPKSTGGRSQLASDISALLEELPPLRAMRWIYKRVARGAEDVGFG